MSRVGRAIYSVGEFYSNLNPSTLTGAVDILLIEDVTDGQLSCSPFHVRFGKLQLLRPQDKIVSGKICVKIHILFFVFLWFNFRFCL